MAPVKRSPSPTPKKTKGGQKRMPPDSSRVDGDDNVPTTKPSAWMNPVVRSWLVSLRPWSFPASLGPVALAGALLLRPPTQADGPKVDSLMTLQYVLCFVVVLSFHAAANLFNTYYDFVSGADTTADADDRGLVDGTVAPSTVWSSAVILLSSGIAAAALLAAQIGPSIFWIVGPASVLCVFYTADPFSLKRYALGDVTIFLMFGPFLMMGVNAATVIGGQRASGSEDGLRILASALQPEIIAYSVPVGLLTVAILHANNARDITADAAAGITTVAGKLGRSGSYFMHCCLFVAAYASIVFFVFIGVPTISFDASSTTPSALSIAFAGRPSRSMLSTEAAASMDSNVAPLTLGVILPPAIPAALNNAATSPRQLIVLLALPWALYVTRSFRDDQMHALPQRVAQHNLVFCTLLVMGLSEPAFLARLLLGCLFYLGGVNNVIMYSYNIALVSMKLSNVYGSPIPSHVSQVLFLTAAFGQLAASVLFMLGIYDVLMAQLLLAWLALVTFVVHDMWTIEQDYPAHVVPKTASPYPAFASRAVPNFPTEFDNEFVHLFKNVQIMGGLVLYCQVFGGA